MQACQRTFLTMEGEFPMGSMSSILSSSALYLRRIHSAKRRKVQQLPYLQFRTFSHCTLYFLRNFQGFGGVLRDPQAFSENLGDPRGFCSA